MHMDYLHDQTEKLSEVPLITFTLRVEVGINATWMDIEKCVSFNSII